MNIDKVQAAKAKMELRIQAAKVALLQMESKLEKYDALLAKADAKEEVFWDKWGKEFLAELPKYHLG